MPPYIKIVCKKSEKTRVLKPPNRLYKVINKSPKPTPISKEIGSSVFKRRPTSIAYVMGSVLKKISSAETLAGFSPTTLLKSSGKLLTFIFLT
jgi:hypothetical protein